MITCKCGSIEDGTRNFCGQCGLILEGKELPNIAMTATQGNKAEVDKILNDAGITSEPEKLKFLSELESGVKPKSEVITGGQVGKIGHLGS